jgi:MFS transporter, SP family, general alpha glucoside:H+ symporter
MGFLVAISSTFSRVAIMDQSAFRVLFAVAWVFPGILAAGLPFLPESPYWLVMRNRDEDARKSLIRLCNKKDDIDARLKQVQTTVEAERRMHAESLSTSFSDCFGGRNWRRTRIMLICAYMPQVVGAVLASNAPYFLNQTGLASETVIMLVQVGISGGLISSILNVFFMMRFHHRALMFSGVGICVVMYLIMGIAGALPRSNATLLVIGISLQFTSLSYGPAVGASVAVMGEVSSSRLRAKSLGISISAQYIFSTVWTIVVPYLFNQDQANLGGNIGWIFFGMGLIMLFVIYFDVPGTKGRSFEELDVMFEKGVSARHFEEFQFGGSD